MKCDGAGHVGISAIDVYASTLMTTPLGPWRTAEVMAGRGKSSQDSPPQGLTRGLAA